MYDRVVVGSDGSPSALYAVSRAHEIAATAEARIVVVAAFEAGGEQGGHRASTGRTVADSCTA